MSADETKTPETATPVKDVKPGYMYGFVADLGSGRQINVGGNFPIGASKEVMNAELDKLYDVLNRQQAKAAVPAIEQTIMEMEARLGAAQADFEALDARLNVKDGQTPRTMPTAEKANRDNAATTIKRMRADLEMKKKFLEKTKKEAE